METTCEPLLMMINAMTISLISTRSAPQLALRRLNGSTNSNNGSSLISYDQSTSGSSMVSKSRLVSGISTEGFWLRIHASTLLTALDPSSTLYIISGVWFSSESSSSF